MVRKGKTMINGVELPDDFSIGSIINNVAISSDGKRYATVTRSKDLVTGEIPADGKIQVDGITITYKKNAGQGVRVSSNQMCFGSFSTQFSGGSVVIGGGNCEVSVGSNLEFEIDKGYDGVSKLTLNESANDINLGLSDDSKVYVKGSTNAEPDFTNGRLFVEGLEGRLLAPETNHELELDIRTSAGDIEGEVAHKGRIRTSAGDIKLELYAPLTLEVSTSAGEVRVKGMISEGRGIYKPINKRPIGTLVLETSAGDIKVKY